MAFSKALSEMHKIDEETAHLMDKYQTEFLKIDDTLLAWEGEMLIASAKLAPPYEAKEVPDFSITYKQQLLHYESALSQLCERLGQQGERIDQLNISEQEKEARTKPYIDFLNEVRRCANKLTDDLKKALEAETELSEKIEKGTPKPPFTPRPSRPSTPELAGRSLSNSASSSPRVSTPKPPATPKPNKPRALSITDSSTNKATQSSPNTAAEMRKRYFDFIQGTPGLPSIEEQEEQEKTNKPASPKNK